jgi:hypothetical protein
LRPAIQEPRARPHMNAPSAMLDDAVVWPNASVNMRTHELE